MPDAEKTPRQTIRIDPELWESFGEITGRRHRSRVIREFIAWYIRKPGAKQIKRPAATDES